jgi:hypothetical protein
MFFLAKAKDKDMLPRSISIIPSNEKSWQERWTSKRSEDLLNIPHSFAMVLVSLPSGGKTNFIKNMIIHQYPPWEEIHIVHGDVETTEYVDIEPDSIMDDLPDYLSFDSKKKKLLIIDDLEISQLNKAQKKNFDRLCSFTRSHSNLSIFLSSQSFYNIPTIYRRTADVFVLWKTRDISSMNTIAKRLGMKKDEFTDLFSDEYIDDLHTSIMIDLTPNSPAVFRKNGYQILDI